MNFVVTDGMVDLTVLVGIIFGILAAGFIAYCEIGRRRDRKGRTGRASGGSKKPGKGRGPR